MKRLRKQLFPAIPYIYRQYRTKSVWRLCTVLPTIFCGKESRNRLQTNRFEERRLKISMEQKHRTSVTLSTSPRKLTLPGKILAVCLCILPFLTRSLTVEIPQAVRSAYFLGDGGYSDFEQLFREFFLLGIAAAGVIWFFYEQIALRPKRKLPMTRLTAVVFILLGLDAMQAIRNRLLHRKA